MYQQLFSRFLAANQGKQHFACHSHYFWPDVTRDAQIQYWDDSAKWVDEKWQHFFTDSVPQVQNLIAQTLDLDTPEQIVFAPNTHELLYRIFSCFELGRPFRVLTTDSEFHSFSRQIKRMEEAGQVHVTRIASLPSQTFADRFVSAIQQDSYDMVFFSQVFFNSGASCGDFNRIVAAVEDPNTIIVMDGYHGFMAKPTDLSAVQDRIFYLSGSYKYAQGGEGACFAVVPRNCDLRPVYTGWYAEFGELSAAKAGTVQYSKNGMRFAGATMDFSAIYRLRAVLQQFAEMEITVAQIDDFIKQCQRAFLAHLEELNHRLLNQSCLLVEDLDSHGHFLTFELPSPADAQVLHDHLREHGVLTDYRANRLRFGFALYHNPSEYDLSCLSEVIS